LEFEFLTAFAKCDDVTVIKPFVAIDASTIHENA